MKRVGYIVVSTDRGLCGGLNINAFKSTVASMKEYADAGVGIDIATIGGRASTFFNSFGGNVVASARDMGESPELADVIGSVRVLLDKFDGEEIDRLMLVSNDFVNTMTHQPTVQQLLPLLPSDDEGLQHHWTISTSLMQRAAGRIVASIYRVTGLPGCGENNACEQAARMLAMKNASDNAGDLIEELGLVYNKARQAAITQELSEIAGGAAAV